MAKRINKKYFILTWKIENFSMCAYNKGEKISSPIFKVPKLNETEWQLKIYPRGSIDAEDDYVSCGLSKIGLLRNLRVVFYSMYELISTEGTSYGKTALVKEVLTESCVCKEFITRSKIFRNKKILLPNDILTLRCHMWMNYKAVKVDTTILKNMLPTTRCRMRTRINKENKIFLWPIKQFCELQVNQRLRTPLITTVAYNPAFDLFTSVNENCYYEFEIWKKCSDQPVFVQCKMSVVDSSGNVLFSEQREHLFTSKGVAELWEFPSSLKMDSLEGVCSSPHEGGLFLKCEFAFSVYGTEESSSQNRGSTVQHRMNSCGVNTLGEQLRQFRQQALFCDVTLYAGDHTFPVHKVILCARSAVFRAMFEHEMKETETGIVVINDFSPDTVDKMLNFLYTEELEGLTEQDAVQLYSAAHKYELSALRNLCANFLKCCLCSSNVYEILMLANTHEDEDLMEAVRNCIRVNSNEIFCSHEWKEFMKRHSDLAADMMHFFITSGV